MVEEIGIVLYMFLNFFLCGSFFELGQDYVLHHPFSSLHASSLHFSLSLSLSLSSSVRSLAVQLMELERLPSLFKAIANPHTHSTAAAILLRSRFSLEK